MLDVAAQEMCTAALLIRCCEKASSTEPCVTAVSLLMLLRPVHQGCLEALLSSKLQEDVYQPQTQFCSGTSFLLDHKIGFMQPC